MGRDASYQKLVSAMSLRENRAAAAYRQQADKKEKNRPRSVHAGGSAEPRRRSYAYEYHHGAISYGSFQLRPREGISQSDEFEARAFVRRAARSR